MISWIDSLRGVMMHKGLLSCSYYLNMQLDGINYKPANNLSMYIPRVRWLDNCEKCHCVFFPDLTLRIWGLHCWSGWYCKLCCWRGKKCLFHFFCESSACLWFLFFLFLLKQRYQSFCLSKKKFRVQWFFRGWEPVLPCFSLRNWFLKNKQKTKQQIKGVKPLE